MPAHPRGERNGGKGAEHQEPERISLQVSSKENDCSPKVVL